MVYRMVFIKLTPTWFIFERFMDCLFLIDIIVNSLSAYKDKHEEIQTSYKLIFYKYLTGWFLIDVIAIIPFDMIE